jgi:ATP-dependent Clp protease ATP-binding subunit ClpB
LKERYEIYHGIKIRDEALVAAATLSNRYITDRFLPDKAIDLVDEAASKLRIEIDSLPTEIDELDRRILQLEIEKEALKKEKAAASKKRLESLNLGLAGLKEKSKEMKLHWQREKEVIDQIRKIKEEIEQRKTEEERYEKQGKLEKVAELRYSILRELEGRLHKESDKLREIQKKGQMLREEVSEEDIAQIVSKWTNIPVAKLIEGELEKLIHMEERLQSRVVGQQEAIEAVSNAVRRSRSGLSDVNRPIGSFIFLGPTGVGKTYLTKSLAWFLFDDENAVIRIDMSEYMEKFSVSRLIGAPPGYVGYEEGGQLTEKVRRRPYAVVLFDEIEKAHPDVFNILLQILEDGRLTDGQGRVVNFKNTVVIMTSNIGSHHFQEASCPKEEVQRAVFSELKKHFRPELINRIDEIVIFNKLSREDIGKIVELEIDGLRKKLLEKNLRLELTVQAKKFLGSTGYDPDFGVRPLRRLIQREIQDKLALKLLSGEFADGDTIKVDSHPETGSFVFQKG